MFDDDLWDFTQVVGLPRQLSKVSRRFDFAAITGASWRLVAKEQIMAMLAPRHDAVMPLPHAYRTPLHLGTAFGRLAELTRFLNWLASQGTTSLADVDEDCCEAWLAHRRYLLDDDGHVASERSPATRRAAAQAVADLVTHRELFTTDRVSAGLKPWRGSAPSVVAEMPAPGQNKTPPVADSVLQPLLAAALYLTGTLGPHAPGLREQVRDADQKWSLKHGEHVLTDRLPAREIIQVLDGYEERREPLPMAAEHVIRRRLDGGWSPDDPLAPISLGLIARQAGFTQFWGQWIPHLRHRIEEALAAVGAEKPLGRDATAVDRADGDGTVPWTAPLDRLEAIALAGIVRTASITLLAAVSGMRSSELMELTVGCCRPPEEHGPGLVRSRLASKVIKGQPLGGTPDEWVVIEPAYQAAQLLERLHDDPQPGKPLLGRFAFDVRHTWFRNWVNGPAGQRLGLAPIPDDPVSLRALRRTLSIELAYRPGGMLAAKLHLKHIAVATTEGYASRPGGAQAELLAEVNKHEADRNLDLVWAELRNYQQGIMPAGPGARELTEFFAHIDGKLADGAHGAPKAQASDRDVLNLITKRARTLHLGTANYCWFTDPSRALCLRLAGTPAADKPLISMCDSARCPQATHHPCHRRVWAEHAEQTKTFLGSLGPTRKTERARLQADHDRAMRERDHHAEGTRHPVSRHDQRTHRFPDPGPGPARRPARRSHPPAAAGQRRRGPPATGPHFRDRAVQLIRSGGQKAPTLSRMSTLTTARLVLRPWQHAFEKDLTRLACDERVMQYIGNGRPWSREQARQRHQACLMHWEDHEFGWRAILDSRGSRFLGLAALNHLGALVPGIEESAIEIGWWLDPAAWGRGIATEAAAAIRDDAFGRLHAERIVARLQPRNHASERVAVKLGMRLHGDAAGRTGEPVLVYVLDRPSWQASLTPATITSQDHHGCTGSQPR